MSQFEVNGAALVADPSGALLWPARDLAVFADLHFEKGSGFARRGTMLPPYDTAATLDRLEAVLGAAKPARVICLGDSFHDGEAEGRLDARDRARLASLVGRAEWTWIAGNHDPAPARALGGAVEDEVTLGPLVFRHEARAGAGTGEISGHFHPVAHVPTRGRRVAGRCFAEDGVRCVLPAFGAYAGGLDVLDRAFRRLFRRGFVVHVIGRGRVHRFDDGYLTGKA